MLHQFTIQSSGYMWMCPTHHSMGLDQTEDDVLAHAHLHMSLWTPKHVDAVVGMLVALSDDCPEHDWDEIQHVIDTARSWPEFDGLPEHFWDIGGNPTCSSLGDLIDRLDVSPCDLAVIDLAKVGQFMADNQEAVNECAERHGLPTIMAAARMLDGNVSWIGEQLAEEFSEWMAGER